jgi:hypothetical protein
MLAVGAYLGFYVFGLVMGVYSPGDVPYFTIPAVVFAVGLVVLAVVGRRGEPGPDEEELTHRTRHLRETRGF